MLELNKIYQGDCLEVMKHIDDKSIDYVFTSPPYNRKRNDKYSFYDDIITDYYKFLCDCIDEYKRITRKHIIVNIQKTYYNKSDVFKLMGKYYDFLQDIIIWEKTNPQPSFNSHVTSEFSLTNSYEFFLIFGEKNIKANFNYTKNIIKSSINNNTNDIHFAVMKQEISDWFICNLTKENDIILDSFMGSGTTALSCLTHNRNFIGIEKIQEYIDMSNKRIDEFKKQDNIKRLF